MDFSMSIGERESARATIEGCADIAPTGRIQANYEKAIED
jgi:hypothetical protein